MNQKGQTAFEWALVFLVIITITIVILGYYIQIQNTTTGVNIVRAEVTKQIALQKENILIEEITINTTSTTNTFTVKLNQIPTPAFDSTVIETKLKSSTSITNPAVVFTS